MLGLSFFAICMYILLGKPADTWGEIASRALLIACATYVLIRLEKYDYDAYSDLGEKPAIASALDHELP